MDLLWKMRYNEGSADKGLQQDTQCVSEPIYEHCLEKNMDVKSHILLGFTAYMHQFPTILPNWAE